MKKSVFVILCLEAAILSFNVAASAALIPSISLEFFKPQFVVGKIIWLYMLPYGVAALFYGPLVRKFDAKKIELWCFAGFVAANFLAAFSCRLEYLFVARFFMGIFGASVIPLALILIARHSEDKKRGSQVGIFFGATFIASLIGLVLSGLINWRMIFLIPAILGALLWLVILFFLPSFKEDKAIFKVNYIAAFKNKTVLLIFGYIFLISLFYHGIQQWLAVYFSRHFRLSQFVVSMLITLTSLAGIFGEVIGGKLADKIGRIKTVDIGIGLMVFSVFVIIFKVPLILLAILMVTWGLGWTFNHAGLSTMLTDLPGEFLHEAASLNSSVRFVAGGLGVVLAGWLMQKSFVTGFGSFEICLIVLALLAKKFLKGRNHVRS